MQISQLAILNSRAPANQPQGGRGLTKREYMSTYILAALLVNADKKTLDPEALSQRAVLQADYLLKALDERESGFADVPPLHP